MCELMGPVPTGIMTVLLEVSRKPTWFLRYVLKFHRI